MSSIFFSKGTVWSICENSFNKLKSFIALKNNKISTVLRFVGTFLRLSAKK